MHWSEEKKHYLIMLALASGVGLMGLTAGVLAERTPQNAQKVYIASFSAIIDPTSKPLPQDKLTFSENASENAQFIDLLISPSFNSRHLEYGFLWTSRPIKENERTDERPHPEQIRALLKKNAYWSSSQLLRLPISSELANTFLTVYAFVRNDDGISAANLPQQIDDVAVKSFRIANGAPPSIAVYFERDTPLLFSFNGGTQQLAHFYIAANESEGNTPIKLEQLLVRLNSDISFATTTLWWGSPAQPLTATAMPNNDSAIHDTIFVFDQPIMIESGDDISFVLTSNLFEGTPTSTIGVSVPAGAIKWSASGVFSHADTMSALQERTLLPLPEQSFIK